MLVSGSVNFNKDKGKDNAVGTTLQVHRQCRPALHQPPDGEVRILFCGGVLAWQVQGPGFGPIQRGGKKGAGRERKVEDEAVDGQ